VRRILIAATTLAALVAAGVAYGATTSNTYTAHFNFNEKGAGTAKQPVPVGFSETLTAANSVAGNRAAPLIDIQVTLMDVKANYKYFPTCSAAKILAAKNDSVCPKGAEVATGTVTAELGDNTLAGQGTPCTPILDVWNGGGGKLNFFFVVAGTHQCGGLQTGSTAPYTGTLVQHGSNLVQNTPLPPDVSTDAGNIGAYGSLTLESLKWAKLTTNVKGKTIPFLESTGCRGGARPVQVAFTATDAAGETLTGSAATSGKC
jgi:hypothetical protein